MDKLYTTEDVSKMYGVSVYTVTQYWNKKGLKHIRGAGKGYLYKKQWIENFLEEEADRNIEKIEVINISKPKINCKKRNIQFVV